MHILLYMFYLEGPTEPRGAQRVFVSFGLASVGFHKIHCAKSTMSEGVCDVGRTRLLISLLTATPRGCRAKFTFLMSGTNTQIRRHPDADDGATWCDENRIQANVWLERKRTRARVFDGTMRARQGIEVVYIYIYIYWGLTVFLWMLNGRLLYSYMYDGQSWCIKNAQKSWGIVSNRRHGGRDNIRWVFWFCDVFCVLAIGCAEWMALFEFNNL